jgi:hypothetical protein
MLDVFMLSATFTPIVLSAIMLSVVAPAESEVISPNVFVCCKNVKKNTVISY